MFAVNWSCQGARFISPSPDIPPHLADPNLGRGESEVIAWAIANPGFKVVLDDRRARSWATRLGLPLLGSLGVIVFLKKHNHITSARPALEKIRDAGGYISEEAIQTALVQVGED